MFEHIKEHKITLLVLFIIVMVLGFVVYQFVSVGGIFSDLKNDLKEIEPSKEFAYTNLSGEAMGLDEYRGQILIVNSWATWSPFSKNDLLTLQEIQKEFGETVTILAINRKEQIPIMRSYLQAYNLDETALVYLHDPSDHFYKASDGFAMPETIIYNKDGTIHSHIRGDLKPESLKQTLKQAVDKN